MARNQIAQILQNLFLLVAGRRHASNADMVVVSFIIFGLFPNGMRRATGWHLNSPNDEIPVQGGAQARTKPSPYQAAIRRRQGWFVSR